MFFHMILLKCLIKFKEEIIKQDPDIITGWNIIDFDILYLKNLFKKNKISFDIGRTNDEPHLRIESGFFKASTANIPGRQVIDAFNSDRKNLFKKNKISFDIGRTNDEPHLRIESGFFKASTANIPGRQVIDAFNSIKDPYIKEAPSIKHAEFETYSLEAVAQAVLGTGKLIKGKDRYEEIERMYKTNQKKLVDYNILDCKLAYDILKKTRMLDLAIERAELTGMALDRLGASVAAFDSLYIREARKQNMVSPTTRYSSKEKRIWRHRISKSRIFHKHRRHTSKIDRKDAHCKRKSKEREARALKLRNKDNNELIFRSLG